MTHMFFAMVALLMLVTGFNQVYCRTGIESVYLGLYKGVVERSVAIAKEKENDLPQPMFYLPHLNAGLRDYFRKNLPPYCRSYTYTISEFNMIVPYSAQVTIRLNVKINDVSIIKKTAAFAITRSSHG